MEQIKEIINWNIIANNNNYNPELEKAMLTEELNETIEAINNNDRIEILDWVIDLFFVWVGTLHKLWFTPEQIEEALDLIIENNLSKFHYENWKYTCIRNEAGKIIKPEWFIKVNLDNLWNII